MVAHDSYTYKYKRSKEWETVPINKSVWITNYKGPDLLLSLSFGFVDDVRSFIGVGSPSSS